jgi:hypothetical protein
MHLARDRGESSVRVNMVVLEALRPTLVRGVVAEAERPENTGHAA